MIVDQAERFLARQSELQHEKLDSKDKQLNQFSPAWKGHGEAVVCSTICAWKIAEVFE